jgi:hypothetical protein
MRLLTACLFSFLVSVSVAAETEEGFTPLFNGKDLTGWKQAGGKAKYSVDGGTIVGTVNDEKKNSFLCTEKSFENFILKLEYKFDTPFDSGVQVRSAVKNGDTVFGYQCQINPALFTGAVWDEARRNFWFSPSPMYGKKSNFKDEELQNKISASEKKEDWNELTIQCIGPNVRTWLNGTPVADFMDTMDDSGFIGLQVHATKEPGQIRWRNIRIRELPSTPWIPFFKDKQFVDLEIKPVGTWEFENDEIVRASTPDKEPRDGLVLSKQVYDNFAARVSFQCSSGNSGLYFRAEEVDKPYWLKGFQCEICDNAATAGLWEVQGRGWVYKPPQDNIKNLDPKGWNDVAITAVGDRLVTELNGKMIVDKNDPKCAKSGKTGLQLHGGGNQGYKFKRYEIKPIPKELVELMVR